MASTFVDLLMDNGELVRIECDSKHGDGLYETIENGMKRGDWWCPSQFDGCTATYMGHQIGRVAMRRLSAWLGGTDEVKRGYKMPSKIYMICNSYESGYGHGLQNDGLDLSKTPHADPEQGEAYQIGYEAGLEKFKASQVFYANCEELKK